MGLKYSRLVLCLLFLACPLAVSAQEPASTFKVGVARRDVTPQEPVPMWGYGARHDALSDGIIDPLFATAVVIQAGDRKLAIVGLDLGRSPVEASLQRIRDRIRREAGIEFSFIAGSHTHHGPVLELSDEPGKGKGRFDAALRYYKVLETQIADAIVEANRNLAPTRFGIASAQISGFNRNRHTKIEPKPTDRDLTLIRFDDATGKPLAAIINFTAHPTMQPSATLKFSADYVGAMRAAVEESLGCKTVFMQGASGDQSVEAGANRG